MKKLNRELNLLLEKSTKKQTSNLRINRKELSPKLQALKTEI